MFEIKQLESDFIVVTSWENDMDNFKDIIIHDINLVQAEAIYDFLQYFRSKNEFGLKHKTFGNSREGYDRVDYNYIKDSMRESNYLQVFNLFGSLLDANYSLLGSSEFYSARVFHSLTYYKNNFLPLLL